MVRDCYDDCIAFLDAQLGRLLDTLQAQGLLENTDVIITSDHGEGFGEHRFYGHSYCVNLNEISVPLVILSPRAPAGRVVRSPVSLRDVPATVVDLLGLSAGSPFPGRSLAAYWGLPPGQESELTTPALTEQADATALENQPQRGREHPGFQMSLVTSDHHYIRNGMGKEQLYNLWRDPNERVDLMVSTSDHQQVEVFRKRLLEMLTDNPGSVEVEETYLKSYRRWLEDLVHNANPTIAISAAE